MDSTVVCIIHAILNVASVVRVLPARQICRRVKEKRRSRGAVHRPLELPRGWVIAAGGVVLTVPPVPYALSVTA